jgi:transketolase
MLGGSADLTESNCTNWQGMQVFNQATPEGRYIHYGVREFGMSAIMNGMAIHQGCLPFGGTFLTFSDYARNAIRLAALMQQRVVYVYTHDSIGLGEDGPTHQPIEHVSSLRLIPGLSNWRPCDTVETAVAWQTAIERQGPSCLLLSRQALPFQERTLQQLSLIQRGAYVLLDVNQDKQMDAVLIATGSEVDLAIQAAKQLKEQDIHVRVVSMPCTEAFLSQDQAYQDQVLPPQVLARVAVEAGVSDYWYKFVGLQGKVVGVDRFGASAPAKEVYEDCGLTVKQIVIATKEVIYSVSDSPLLKEKCA